MSEDLEIPQPAAEDSGPPNGRWETLSQAFAAHRFPIENLALVQQLVDSIGIDHYEGIQSGSYIKGIRTGKGRNLHIHYGYTGGMDSEDEILDSVGDIERDSWFEGREWWITHPVNRARGGGGSRNQSTEREVSFCPNCFMQLPASGVCDECGA